MIAIVAATNLPLWPSVKFHMLTELCNLEQPSCYLRHREATNMGGLGGSSKYEGDGQQIWPGSAVWCVEWNFPFCRPGHFPICCLLAPILPPNVESLPTNSLLLYWAKVNVKRDVFFSPSSDLGTIAWGLLLCHVEQSLNEAAFRAHWQKPKRYQ